MTFAFSVSKLPKSTALSVTGNPLYIYISDISFDSKHEGDLSRGPQFLPTTSSPISRYSTSTFGQTITRFTTPPVCKCQSSAAVNNWAVAAPARKPCARITSK
jgi:hypothetical protein